MGNIDSLWRGKRESKKKQERNSVHIPEISVTEASPVPAEESVFTLPGPVDSYRTAQEHAVTDGLSPPQIRKNEQNPAVIRRRSSKGSQSRSHHRLESDNLEDDGQFDVISLSGSEGSRTPTGSRTHFIQVMMDSSPQVRRSMVQRRSVHLASRSDGDSISQLSSNPEEDRTVITLDPLEHQWMMCASDAEWASLHHLLSKEPTLLLRKDFVTGFTCLHWAAKHGKPELIALIINFAKQNNVPLNVDVRSNAGYTPLHIAAIQNQMEVVKLLVGAYDADVEVRDFSGRKACQYLTDKATVDIRDIIGAYEKADSEKAKSGIKNRGRWSFSKALQSNTKLRRALSSTDCDTVESESQPRVLPVRRKTTFSRIRPKLRRIRKRTSQIVHSTTFHDTDDTDRPEEEIRSRHKSYTVW